jgi:hypothetical protein
MSDQFQPTWSACSRPGVATNHLIRSALLVAALHAAACADQPSSNGSLAQVSNKKCASEYQLLSEQAIKDVLTHNVFSFADSEITVNRPVEIFGENGSYKVVSARPPPTIGGYSINRGIVNIRSPQPYFNLPAHRILVKSPDGKMHFCDSKSGLPLPLAAIAR